MAWYRVGTVNVTNGSKNVVGVGTDWLSVTGTAQVSNSFVGPDGRIYEVGSVLGAGSLQLVESYAGATLAAQAYAIMPTMGLSAELARQVGLLIQKGTSGLTIKGVKSSYEELLTITGSTLGDAWVVGVEGEGELYLWTETGWFYLSSIGVTPELQALRTDALNAKDDAQAARDATQEAQRQYNLRNYPGQYAVNPPTRPDGSASQVGDSAQVLVGGAYVQKIYNGGTWNLPNPDAAALATTAGATLVGAATRFAALDRISSRR